MRHLPVPALPSVPEANTAYYVATTPGKCRAVVVGKTGDVRTLEGGLEAKTFSQALPSAAWTIAHNLGRRPVDLTIRDTSGDECVGVITHPDVNTTTVTFSAAFGGTASYF